MSDTHREKGMSWEREAKQAEQVAAAAAQLGSSCPQWKRAICSLL